MVCQFENRQQNLYLELVVPVEPTVAERRHKIQAQAFLFPTTKKQIPQTASKENHSTRILPGQ